jgi:hypothetical protein
MSLEEELERKSGISVRKIGSLRLMTAPDAMSFLDACLASGALVLGVEGFRLKDGEVHPDQNAIADFSGLEQPQASIDEARRFVERTATPSLLFDFTIAEGSGT